jgi:L-iditol 2-dehydrogenase
MVRKRGRVVLFGGLPKDDPITELDSNIIHYNELTVFGAFSYHPRFHAIALDMLARGQVQSEKIITNTYPIERAVEAFEALKGGQEVKAVITPNL